MESETPGLTSPTPDELLREYLQAAPPELSDWAQAQLALLEGKQVEGEQIPTEVSGVSRNAAPLAVIDEGADFYDDMEGEDDLLQRRQKRQVEKAGAVLPTELPGRSEPARVSGGAKIALVLALALGAAFGIWYAGKEPAVEPTAGPPTLSESAEAAPNPMHQIELEEIVQSDPDNVDARLELGVLYFNQRQVTLATQQWEEVTRLDANNVTAWYNLGFAYMSADPPDMGAVQDAWQRVVDIAPDSELAQTVTMHLEEVGSTGGESSGE